MNLIIVTLLVLNVFAPYVGSWLPAVGGSPAGGVIRDAAILLFLSGTAYSIVRSMKLPLLQITYLFFWGVFCIWMSILIVTGGQIGAAILGARNILLFPLVGFMVLINMQKGLIDYFSVKKCLYVLCGISALLGILDVATKGAILSSLGYKSDYAGGDLFSLVVEYLGIRRATGGLSDALNYGYTMAMFAVYIMFHLFNDASKSRMERTISYLLVIMSSTAVVLSLTRGAILVLLLGFLVFIILLGSKRQKYSFLAFLVLGLVALSFTEYSELLYGRFTDSEKNSAESSQIRVDMAEKAVTQIKSNFFGIGLGTQGAGGKLLTEDTRITTDNYFLWVALESGVIGLLFLLLTQINNVIICFSAARKHKTVLIYFGYMTTGYAITGLLSSAPISPLYAIIFWIIMNIETARLGTLRQKELILSRAS